MLVRVRKAVAKIPQGLRRRLSLAQPPARDQLIDQVRSPDCEFGEKLGSIEQQEQQIEDARVAVPELEQR